MIRHRFYPIQERPEWGIVATKDDKPKAAKFIAHTGWAKHKTDIEEPAADGATWPCGHPKTTANTQSVGAAGFRCRICRRALGRKCGSRVRGKAA